MNLIKSIFIFIAPVWLVLVVYFGVKGLFESQHVIFYIGVIISALPLLTFLAYIMMFKRLARTSEHLLSVSMPSLIGYVLVLMFYLRAPDYSKMIDMMLTMSAFLITFLYIYWYSNNAREPSRDLSNGKQLPTFVVKDQRGNEVSSETWHAKSSLIFFYRGNWCPLCMAQIGEIAKQYKIFEEKDIQVILIAPQSAHNTKKLAQKYNLGFQFYIDENNKIANQLGILHKFGLPMGFQALGYDSDSVYPTVVATNDQGVIIYNDQTSNYRIRPEPQELIQIFS